jgi:hypothetical protein
MTEFMSIDPILQEKRVTFANAFVVSPAAKALPDCVLALIVSFL